MKLNFTTFWKYPEGVKTYLRLFTVMPGAWICSDRLPERIKHLARFIIRPRKKCFDGFAVFAEKFHVLIHFECVVQVGHFQFVYVVVLIAAQKQSRRGAAEKAGGTVSAFSFFTESN